MIPPGAVRLGQRAVRYNEGTAPVISVKEWVKDHWQIEDPKRAVSFDQCLSSLAVI
jgi:hypothetical protein